MKKNSLALWLTAFLILSVFAAPAYCEEKFKIVILQHQDFPPYRDAAEGFVKGFKQSGFYSRVNIEEHYNARGDLKALEAKVARLSRRKEVDLILTLGTHATTRAIKEIKDIPILFTGLGDPENSGVISDWKRSGANYTGVETPGYLSLGVKLIKSLYDFDSLGIVFLEGSPSHEGAVKQLRKLSGELGFKFVYKGFPLRDKEGRRFSADVVRDRLKQSLSEVCPQVEVFYVQTSGTFQKNFDLFRSSFLANRTISSGDPLYINKGITMGIGRDVGKFGEQCALYAEKILTGTPPSELPMDTGTKLTLEVNLTAADQVGYDPPIELLGSADNITEEIDY